jgi:hypothetical protein
MDHPGGNLEAHRFYKTLLLKFSARRLLIGSWLRGNRGREMQSEVKGSAIGVRLPASWKQNMRAPFITSLLATACFAGAGCTSAPQQDPPVASHDRACANPAYDPLHMVSSKKDTTRDPDIESLLNQSADPRLAWVNRQMYLSLRSLDVELRREQRVAECEHPQASQMLEAWAGGGTGAGDVAGSAGRTSGGVGSAPNGGGTADGGSAGAGGVSAGGVGTPAGGALTGGGGAPAGGVVAITTNAGTGSTATSATASSAASQSSIAGGTSTGTARSTLVRKSSVSGAGAGGNGATAQKSSAGSDNDIVARRLRKAAEQETDPALQAKLWKEYKDFRLGMSAR